MVSVLKKLISTSYLRMSVNVLQAYVYEIMLLFFVPATEVKESLEKQMVLAKNVMRVFRWVESKGKTFISPGSSWTLLKG